MMANANTENLVKIINQAFVEQSKREKLTGNDLLHVTQKLVEGLSKGITNGATSLESLDNQEKAIKLTLNQAFDPYFSCKAQRIPVKVWLLLQLNNIGKKK